MASCGICRARRGYRVLSAQLRGAATTGCERLFTAQFESKSSQVPKNAYWGPGQAKKDRADIVEFKVPFDNATIADLHQRLRNTRWFIDTIDLNKECSKVQLAGGVEFRVRFQYC